MFSPVNPTPAPAAVPSFAVPSFLAGPSVAGLTIEGSPVKAGDMLALTPEVTYPPSTSVHYVPVEVMPAGVPDMAHILAARDPNNMDDDQLRQLMEAAPLVNQLLEGVKKEIERRLHSGKPVKGFKLVQGKGSREWALPEEEMAKKFAGMNIPKTAIYVKKMISPAQAEKLVWDKNGEPCSLSDTQKKRMETEYIKKIPGAPVVVPESDSRPAIGPMDASSLFAPVDAPAAPATPVPSFLQAAPKPSFL